MILRSVRVEAFRNIETDELGCAPGINLVVGANASGKTSLMEAVYFLARGRSFRTRRIGALVCHGRGRFRVVAELASGDRTLTVGVERGTGGGRVRVGGRDVRALAELSQHLPVLLINPGAHRLLEAGARYRRGFLDWGLFHSGGAFLGPWRRFRVALRNRNASLRRAASPREVASWHPEIINNGNIINMLRDGFGKRLEARLVPLAEHLLDAQGVRLDFHRGWPAGRSLAESLDLGLERDRVMGFTRHGPHRADFTVRFGDRPAVEYLSRGQQKLLVVALVLAQAALYHERRGEPAILLVDDLPSELDEDSRRRVMAALAESRAQLFVTALEPGLVDLGAWPAARRFQIEEGKITELL